MEKQTDEIKIGQEIFIINNHLEIEPKRVMALINEEGGIKYRLDVYACEGKKRDEIFLTKAQAEKVKQDFLDKLKFKVGDLIVFKFKEYGTEETDIGRIKEIYFNENYPYKITTAYKNSREVSEGFISLKIRNEYIESFGNLTSLYEDFEKKEKEILDIIKKINHEHDKLEKDLLVSFKKEYGFLHFNRKKPLFKDKFNYNEYD